MTPERWTQVKDLFQSALTLEPEARPAFLDKACGGDSVLRTEIESLIAAHHQAGTFIDSPIFKLESAELEQPRREEFQVGQTIGPYEVVALIGSGGMGVVYRARDRRLNRDVAIKVLSRALAQDPDRLRRFTLEAQSASALNHANILVIHDFGTHEGMPYIVSEFLEGETLRERLRPGVPIALPKIIDFALQCASGLAAAHEKNIVHRDLKPENLFVTADGRIKILDFGLAKLTQRGGLEKQGAEGATDFVGTNPGALLGTVGYMSPEQAAGRQVDFRSDQFGLGVVLYELTTRKRAFERPTAVETLSAIIREEPEPIHALNPRVPPPFRWIIERCLAKAPAERFASTWDLARDLETLKNHISELGTGRDAGGAAGQPAMRRGVRAIVVAGVAAAVVLLAILGLRRFAAAPVPQSTALRYLTFSGHDASPAVSPDGRTIVYSSDRDGQRRIWMKELNTGNEVAITSGGPDDFPRFSPDGSFILFSRGDPFHASLYRLGIVGGEPRKLLDDVIDADWSPDGTQIAFVRWRSKERRISTLFGLLASNSGDAHDIGLVESRTLWHPRWSPDGKTIAAVEQSAGTGLTSLIYLAAADGKGMRSMPAATGGFAISSLAWSANGGDVVYFQSETVQGGGTVAGGTARVVRHNTKSGNAQILYFSLHNSTVLDIAGAGRIIFDTGSSRQNLRELSLVHPAEPGHWLTRGNSQDRQPVYSPDGEWVMFSSNRTGNLDLWSVSTKTGALRRLTDDPADDWDPAYTPDGQKILWSSNRGGHLEIWTAAADGSGARRLTDDGVDAENPTATLDGQWVVYWTANPAKKGIWKIHPDGSGAARLVPGEFVVPEVSPDGKHAAYTTTRFNGFSLHVVRIADGAPVPFSIEKAARPRWLPQGRALAFTSTDERGVIGVAAQDFIPGKDTMRSRRILSGFDPDMPAETYGLSPDGTRMTLSTQERLFNLMIAESVPGVSRPPRPTRN